MTIIPDLTELQIRNKYNKKILKAARKNLREEGLIDEPSSQIDVDSSKVKLLIKKTAQQLSVYANSFKLIIGPTVAAQKIVKLQGAITKLQRRGQSLADRIKIDKDKFGKLIKKISTESRPDVRKKLQDSIDILDKEIQDLTDEIDDIPFSIADVQAEIDDERLKDQTEKKSAEVFTSIGTEKLPTLGPKLTINTSILSSELNDLAEDPNQIPRKDLSAIVTEIMKDLVPAMTDFYNRFPGSVEDLVWASQTGPKVASLEGIKDQTLPSIKLFNRDIDNNLKSILTSIEVFKRRQQVVGLGVSRGEMPRKFV